MVDATRFGVHGCEPERVSDGSRLALCQTLSIECPSSIFSWHVYFVIPVSFSSSFFCVFVFFFCSHWSLVDVPLIFFCPADHVPDWQPRILLGLVVVVVVVVVSHIQRIGCQPEKTTLHGGQSRSWSAEQGKENKRKSLAAYPPPHPPHCSFGENK